MMDRPRFCMRSDAHCGTHFDAIVIGAGPAGASTAILLAAAGWSVALVEKQRFPRRKVCGECIAASNLPLFDALGVGDAFASLAGPPLRRVALMQGRRTIVTDLPARPDGHHRWGRALGRTALDPLLLRRAREAGATVLQPWSLRTCDGGPGAWTCTVAQVETAETMTVAAPVMVAAHGSWQRIGGASSDEPVRKASDLFAFKAEFTGGTLADGLLPVLSFDGGYGGMVRIGGDTTTLAGCIRRDALDAARARLRGRTAGEAFEDHVRGACRGAAAALDSATRSDAWLAAGPIRPGIRITAGRSGPFVVGNAAGEAHPIVGEGISMAMQSAWLLCARLVAARDALLSPHRGDETRIDEAAAVRRAYVHDWHRHFAPRLRIAATLAHLAMRPAWSAPLLPLLRLRPALLADAARAAGKLRCAADADTIAAIRPSPRPVTPPVPESTP